MIIKRHVERGASRVPRTPSKAEKTELTPAHVLRRKTGDPGSPKTAQRVSRHGQARLGGSVPVSGDEQCQKRHDENAEPVDERGSYKNPEGPWQEMKLGQQRHGWKQKKWFMESWKRSKYAKRAGSFEPAR
jgi:hypothetical protein